MKESKHYELAGHRLCLGNILLLKLNVKCLFTKLFIFKKENCLDLLQITIKPRIHKQLLNNFHRILYFISFQRMTMITKYIALTFLHLNITSKFKKNLNLIQVN